MHTISYQSEISQYLIVVQSHVATKNATKRDPKVRADILKCVQKNAKPEGPQQKFGHFISCILVNLRIFGIPKSAQRMVLSLANMIQCDVGLCSFALYYQHSTSKYSKFTFCGSLFQSILSKKDQKYLFFQFFVFFQFFMYFFLTSKQICIFTFFENPCFAFKNNTKSSSFTKNMLKMITI